jgi:hypothetical protein
MRVIMEERVERDFMIIQKSKHAALKLYSFVTILVISVISCSPDLSDDPIPPANFPDITINLNLPEYIALRSAGNYKAISGGVRGIILYAVNSSTYYAFERNCSYHPNEACATIDVHISGLYLNDTCCGSTFDFNGNPTGGVAWKPLRKYETFLDGSELTITDSVL